MSRTTATPLQKAYFRSQARLRRRARVEARLGGWLVGWTIITVAAYAVWVFVDTVEMYVPLIASAFHLMLYLALLLTNLLRHAERQRLRELDARISEGDNG
jgi:cobalamin biosynthesis protein CobD/CbiB